MKFSYKRSIFNIQLLFTLMIITLNSLNSFNINTLFRKNKAKNNNMFFKAHEGPNDPVVNPTNIQPSPIKIPAGNNPPTATEAQTNPIPTASIAPTNTKATTTTTTPPVTTEDPNSYQKIWAQLFDALKDSKGVSQNAKGEETDQGETDEKEGDSKKNLDDKIKNNDSNATWGTPKKKTNKYANKNIGYGLSAYFFDYIDDILQAKISNRFSEIYNECNTIELNEQDKTYQDSYSLDRLLTSTPTDFTLTTNESQNLVNMKKLSPSFNIGVWKDSLNSQKINACMKRWHWMSFTNRKDSAKSLIDKYDFNGDGRLSRSEFIIAMINNNKSISGTGKCSHCLEEIIKVVVDPIFMYMDANNNGKLTAEEMTKALPFLKRVEPANYDIFSCHINHLLYRTSAFNDFIIKATRKGEAELSREDFRLGILIGYWMRQTDDTSIYSEATVIDTKSQKQLRWVDKVSDKECEELKANVNNA